MVKLSFVPFREIQRVRTSVEDIYLRAKLLADICRINILYMVKRAGSGHIGTSFSSIDIMSWLWTEEMKGDDIFFSSKGHDAPALYSILIALGKLPFEKIHQLRRLGGLPGHPNIGTPGIVTNTGSLGMGISKARGMAKARRLQKKSGRIYVLLGDGELQEGQIWESLQKTANERFAEITAIVDHNKIQSDILLKNTSDLGNIEEKFAAFGWAVRRVDGNDCKNTDKALFWAKSEKNRPQVIIADTLKGKGVSFMERLGEDGYYKYHSGAPSDADYEAALYELMTCVNSGLQKAKQKYLELESVDFEATTPILNSQKILRAYGDELVNIGKENKKLVVLDADLVVDTGIRPFKENLSEQFIECGIAEQDMVSMAGGLALEGMLPVVHSFGCFLSTRPNEQIYNNATERTKIIYVSAMSGLLPAFPGHSHQSVRDIASLGAIPGLVMIEPSCEAEAKMALRWAVEKNQKSTYLRLCNASVEISYSLPDDYVLEYGKGVFLKNGGDAVIVAYGQVMLEEACRASEILEKKGIEVAVVNLPWLNYFDGEWISKIFKPYETIFTLDDHYLGSGQGAALKSKLCSVLPEKHNIYSLGLKDMPECGTGEEVLATHRLNAESLAGSIEEELRYK